MIRRVRQSKLERNQRIIQHYNTLRSTGTRHGTAIKTLQRLKYVKMGFSGIEGVIRKEER